jgi:hypothetical protein
MVRPTPLMPPPPRLTNVAVCPSVGRLTVIGPLPLFTALLLPIWFWFMFSVPPFKFTVEIVVPCVLVFAMLPEIFAVPPLTVKVAVATAEATAKALPLVKFPNTIFAELNTPAAVLFGVAPPIVIDAVGPIRLLPPVSLAMVMVPAVNVPVSNAMEADGPPSRLAVSIAMLMLPACTFTLWPAKLMTAGIDV